MKEYPIVHPFKWVRDKGRWPYRLTSELWFEFPNRDFGCADFYDENGKHWAKARGNLWGLHPDYSIDGCTGVRTTEASLPAAFYHDSTGQWFHTKCIKRYLNRAMWNADFRDLIIAQGEPIRARVYWLGLTLLNPAYQIAGRILGNKPSGTCEKR